MKKRDRREPNRRFRRHKDHETWPIGQSRFSTAHQAGPFFVTKSTIPQSGGRTLQQDYEWAPRSFAHLAGPR